MKKLMMMMLGALAVSAGAQAETIHGACDDLQGTAGGAYGLCVAICEVPAEDENCMPTYVDGVLVADSLENCRPASAKLIEKFHEKAPVGVDLPCGDYQSSVACPCPDPMMDNISACIPRSTGGGQVNGVVQPNGEIPSFIIGISAGNWVCRTIEKDGTGVLLTVPGPLAPNPDADACLDIYRSYCPD